MQNRWTRRVIPSLALILASSVAVARAQWPPAGQLRALLDKTSLHRLTEGDPPVTTGLDDALTGIDFLDRYKPSTFAPLDTQRQDAAGAFHVGPGVYEFTAESYCLHAGTHGPGGGDGYVSAPLQGSKRDAVHRILQNAVAHPEIRQQDIQVLLWAILARTRISDMPRNTQLTAARLLTPGELVALNGGAFGLVTDRAWGETNQSLPPAMRRAFEAEARFRQVLSAVDASFVDIERLAVLGGDPAPDAASRKIPEGRWSYHPEGYFIRFFPSGYSRTEVQVYVPEPMTIVRDNADRIAWIIDQQGARFDVGYVDRVTDHRPTATRQAAAWRALLEMPTIAGAGGTIAPPDTRDLVDLAQLHAGLEAALNAGRNRENADRLTPVIDLVSKAWAAEFCVQAGGCVRDARSAEAGIPLRGLRFTSVAEPVSPALGPTAPGAIRREEPLDSAGRLRSSRSRPMLTHTVDLAETVAVPGHRGRQRLGLSGRSQR